MEILQYLNLYEKKHGKTDCYLQIFSGGGGMLLDEDDLMLFSFENYDELIRLLKQ